ncbi:MAG: hypothetical protein PHG61_08525 [Candidatus Marinimicrobia bacterium]|nr:hypothetical protein [Candidatus Neomarinimicrobiota bacterium]
MAMANEINKVCEERFERLQHWQDQIEIRLKEGSIKMENQGMAITQLSTDMQYLVKQMASLTKALWGAAGSVGMIGVGFIVWFIQTH